MQRKRQRKMTIDIMLEENEFLKKYQLLQKEQKSNCQSEEILSSFQTNHSKIQHQKVQQKQQKYLNQLFVEHTDFFEIKIKRANSKLQNNSPFQDVQSTQCYTQEYYKRKEKYKYSINPQDKIDHGGTNELVELMWTQNLKKQEIQRIINRQKCTISTNDRNSSIKPAELYLQLKQDHQQQKNGQKQVQLHGLKKKLSVFSQNKKSSQQNKQCCQIM